MATKIDWLIVGLGNPGSRYAETRHNVGWMAALVLCNQHKASIKQYRGIAFSTIFKIDSSVVLCCIPTTYMNNSGEAVAKIAREYDVPIERICIIVDEYNFPVGKVHLKVGGSDGGHNGVASVVEHLNTTEFLRLRCGIDKNFPQGGMVDYVLSKFNDNEIELRNDMINKAVESIEYLVRHGKVKAMTDINSEALFQTKED